MNEQDLKRAFQNVVVASSPPPAMDPGRALDVARKARSKRRASMVGALVGVLVVGIGLGSAFALNPKGAKEYMVGAGPNSSSSAAGDPVTEWGDQWPIGQTDRTATNGPQADRGDRLQELLVASVPEGYDTPALKYQRPEYQSGDMLRNQAQISTNKGEKPEIWDYTAYVPVRKDNKVGILVARVSMPNPRDPADLCELGKRFVGRQDALCKIRDVDGKQVAEASAPSPEEDNGTWMTYRAPNGWTVAIMQDADYDGGGYPALDSAPMLTSQQAALAADPKFVLGG